MTASEFAHEFARQHLETDVTIGAARLMTNLDQSLQEVREVLDGLLSFSDNVIEAWDIKPMPADRVTLDRARSLYNRLSEGSR